MINSLSIDLLIRIKNGYRAERKSISAPNSKFNRAILDILKKYSFIKDYQVKEEDNKMLKIQLSYTDFQAAVTDIDIFSKPGRRFYEKSSSLPWGKTTNSLIIVSTSQGLLSQKEAVSKKLGGELIAEIY